VTRETSQGKELTTDKKAVAARDEARHQKKRAGSEPALRAMREYAATQHANPYGRTRYAPAPKDAALPSKRHRDAKCA